MVTMIKHVKNCFNSIECELARHTFIVTFYGKTHSMF